MDTPEGEAKGGGVGLVVNCDGGGWEEGWRAGGIWQGRWVGDYGVRRGRRLPRQLGGERRDDLGRLRRVANAVWAGNIGVVADESTLVAKSRVRRRTVEVCSRCRGIPVGGTVEGFHPWIAVVLKSIYAGIHSVISLSAWEL